MDWNLLIIGVLTILVGIAIALFGLSLVWQAKATALNSAAIIALAAHLSRS
jgi:hypothetical protein